jgi:hypothetical protein
LYAKKINTEINIIYVDTAKEFANKRYGNGDYSYTKYMYEISFFLKITKILSGLAIPMYISSQVSKLF